MACPSLSGFLVHCHDLNPRLEVDGTLGLDILRLGELRVKLPEDCVRFDWA